MWPFTSKTESSVASMMRKFDDDIKKRAELNMRAVDDLYALAAHVIGEKWKSSLLGREILSGASDGIDVHSVMTENSGARFIWYISSRKELLDYCTIKPDYLTEDELRDYMEDARCKVHESIVYLDKLYDALPNSIGHRKALGLE